jgi:acylphosphatase
MDAMTERAITATVRGRVQGVGFRVATRRVAQGLGVSGWVRNLPDGSVAVFAQGDPGSIDDLLAFLDVGPPAAHVTGVEIAEATPARHLLGFDVTR